MLISHFQYEETKGKDYFRKAWKFSFVSGGQFFHGVYHQDGTIEWAETALMESVSEAMIKEIHHLMAFHIFS